MSRYYTQEHEWIEVEGESAPVTATVGITDYAQGQLGDITFVELPAPGASLAKGGSASVVDSVKAASDGVKTSFASAICLGWIAHFPTIPSVADRRACALKPSSSEKSPNGPSTGSTPCVRHAATIAACAQCQGSDQYFAPSRCM